MKPEPLRSVAPAVGLAEPEMMALRSKPQDVRRQAILDAAREVFLEDGFAGASMSAIALRLGGSKATLYSYFTSKHQLFAAYIEEACARATADAFDHVLGDDAPIETTLEQVGERLLAHIYAPWAIDNFRVVVAEARRSPELAALFYTRGLRWVGGSWRPSWTVRPSARD
jgi:AcrR family transcriptional regulator